MQKLMLKENIKMNFSKYVIYKIFSSFRAEYEPFTTNDMISSKIKEINVKIENLIKVKNKLIEDSKPSVNRILSFKENDTLNENDIEFFSK
jgi:hypothetical protein